MLTSTSASPSPPVSPAYSDTSSSYLSEHEISSHLIQSPNQKVSPHKIVAINGNLITPIFTGGSNKTPSGKHIKRPMNAFMVWARLQRKRLAEEEPGLHNADISRRLGAQWRGLGEHERREWVEEAERLRILHMQEYPDYKYQPKIKSKPKILPDGSYVSAILGEGNGSISPLGGPTLPHMEPLKLRTSSHLKTSRVSPYETGREHESGGPVSRNQPLLSDDWYICDPHCQTSLLSVKPQPFHMELSHSTPSQADPLQTTSNYQWSENSFEPNNNQAPIETFSSISDSRCIKDFVQSKFEWFRTDDEHNLDFPDYMTTEISEMLECDWLENPFWS